MTRTLTLDCNHKVGQKVTLFGFISTIRDHGKITFYDLRDASSLIQTVAKQKYAVSPEDVVKIEGTVKKRPPALINKNIATRDIEIDI